MNLCTKCYERHWCDKLHWSNMQHLCLHKLFSYDIDADRIYNVHITKETRHHRAFIKGVNRDSATFLGVYVAEFILSKVFKNVKRMPPCNPGYDFICNKGMKIDVKSSCLSKMNNWQFTTNNNTTADHFLCIAFDNRKDLNPLHLWLLPMEYMHNLSKISVSPNTVSKLDAYKLDINKTIACCDTLRP